MQQWVLPEDTLMNTITEPDWWALPPSKQINWDETKRRWEFVGGVEMIGGCRSCRSPVWPWGSAVERALVERE